MSKKDDYSVVLGNEVARLRSLIEKAVARECMGRTGCVFSSGIDSALITLIASRICDITAYTVGVGGSEDLKYARMAQKDLGFPVKIIEITVEETERILPDLIRIIGSVEPLKVSVGVPLYFAAREAQRDGVSVMLSGQGGDELFGGYNRYLSLAAKDRPALKGAMKKDADNAYADNLDRDMAICRAFGIDLRFPYMDEAFVKYVSGIPTRLKIYEVGENEKAEFECVDEFEGKRFIRKYLLRHIAADAGLPKYIIDRRKKAAQYGSGSQKIIGQLARRNGYRQKAADVKRSDYIRMYLESLA